ncbi:hypothetical protein L7F22_023331, partial [Adiantum nelumboides]|nr:hypothetical protein [Adiantum nelumboides]
MKVEELKNNVGKLLLTLQTLQVVVEDKAPLEAMDSALKERDFIEEVEECAQAHRDFVKSMQVKRVADPFIEVKFAGEAKPDIEVEIVEGYNCEEQDPKVEVHVEKEDGAARKPTEDAEWQTKTSKDQVEKETRENSNMESGRKDAATSNIDNLDHIISMIAKSTLKDPLDVDTSFKVESQVPCASNIEDQGDKNTEFFVLSAQ